MLISAKKYRDDRLSRAIDVIENSTCCFDMGDWRLCAVAQMFAYDRNYLDSEGLTRVRFYLYPVYENSGGCCAMAKYFGIKRQEAAYAFMWIQFFNPRHGANKATVIKYLRKVQARYRRSEARRIALKTFFAHLRGIKFLPVLGVPANEIVNT